jgi:hypothetical protein
MVTADWRGLIADKFGRASGSSLVRDHTPRPPFLWGVAGSAVE